MSEDKELVNESAETRDAAYAAAVARAAERWGHDNFDLTMSANPSKDLTTGQLLYTAVAKRRADKGGGGQGA